MKTEYTVLITLKICSEQIDNEEEKLKHYKYIISSKKNNRDYAENTALKHFYTDIIYKEILKQNSKRKDEWDMFYRKAEKLLHEFNKLTFEGVKMFNFEIDYNHHSNQLELSEIETPKEFAKFSLRSKIHYLGLNDFDVEVYSYKSETEFIKIEVKK